MLIERGEQLAQLRRNVLSCEKRRQGHVALVTGPVGSGKTQLLESFGTWAATTGARVLTAAGSRAEQGLPFGVLGQLLHGARLAGSDTTRVEELTREAAGAVPTAEARWAAADELPAEGPMWQPLLREVFTTLLDLVDRGPLVLVVDDLQHVDATSLHCLLYVTRRLNHAPVMVLLSETLTLGPANPLFHAELRSRPQLSHLALPPLAVDSLARQLHERGGGHGSTPSGEVVQEARRLHQMTGGNPLLVQALVVEPVRRAESRKGVPVVRVGDAFGRAVLHSLYRHEPDARNVARALAVLDRPASQELLGQLLGLLPASVASALRVLHSSGLVDTDRLRHPRILHAVLSDTPAEVRQRLHERAARTLHEYGAEPSVVAGHLVASGWTGEEWVAPVLQDAAEQALAAGRPDLTVGYLRLGCGAGADEERRKALAAMLVDARWQVNPLAAGGDLDRLMRSAGPGRDSSSPAVAAVPYLLWQGRAEEAAEAVAATPVGKAAEPGSAPAGAADSGDGRLQAMRLLVSLSHPDFLVSTRTSQGLWSAAATAPHSVSPLLQSLSVLGSALLPTEEVDSTAAAEQFMQRHHLDRGSRGLLVAPLLALLYGGRADRVVAWSGTLLGRSELRHAPVWRSVVRAIRAEAALRLGDLAEAEKSARTALEDLPAPAWGVAVGVPLATLITCATESGGHAEADRWLAEPVPPGMFRTPMGAHYLIARGAHHLGMGRYQAASSDFQRCGAMMRGWNLEAAGLAPWRLELARVQIGLGNRTHAAQLLREQLHVPHGLDERTRGRALHLLATTAAPDHRRKLLTKAVELFRSCGDQLGLARALADDDQVLPQAGEPGRTVPFLLRAEDAAQGPGAGPWVRKAPEWQGASGEAPAGVEGADRDDVLSEAELRVAVLAARGQTNRQISDALFITVSTVEQHLTRTYRKLNVRQRTDLPSWLLAMDDQQPGKVQSKVG
ncbi:helix-turn-helix transcriptional regulator [Streptomyces sp. SCA2-2]|uniref:helix-turn-helix transcriptional regulator n=1 Tax=Streptomyces sp. SCA2-2 TaxID=1563677 RepID=UPI001020E8E2|nr:LuxR family transcriptional regulator [Streptomyces sp. SCA2-2]RZE88366.1 LuxR family transcriptional regulator [Streptomyces sp. SCA2-2]